MGQLTNQNVNVDMGVQSQDMMRTQTRGTQALAAMRPREIKRVEHNAMEEAAMLGELSMYGWGAGKDRIEGPSWELAKSLMRVYGNCSLDMEPVQELSDAWVFTARAVDHETGYSISRQFRQSKRWAVYGKFDDARKDDIRFQVGQSKALRNVAMAFLPGWLVERAMDVARGGIRESITGAIEQHGMEAVIERAVNRAAQIGCDESRLLAAMGRKARAAITVEDLIVILTGIKAIERGADVLDDVFPLAAAAPASNPAVDAVMGAIAKNTGKAAPNTGGNPKTAASSPTIPPDGQQQSGGTETTPTTSEPPQTVPTPARTAAQTRPRFDINGNVVDESDIDAAMSAASPNQPEPSQPARRGRKA